jgi:hypothetical protein
MDSDKINLEEDDHNLYNELLNVIELLVIRLQKSGHFYDCLFAKNHLLHLHNNYQVKPSKLVNELAQVENFLSQGKWSNMDRFYVFGTLGMMYPVVRNGRKNEVKRIDKRRHDIIRQITFLEKVMLP